MLPTIFMTKIVRQHSFCKVYLVFMLIVWATGQKKKGNQSLLGFGFGFFPCFWLQWKTGKKTANMLLITEGVRGFILCFIWGGFWIKALAWFLVDNIFIKNSITFLVRWCAGFFQITVTVVQGNWKFLEKFFCIMSTNSNFLIFLFCNLL